MIYFRLKTFFGSFLTGIFRELPSARSSSQAPSHALIRSFSRSFVTIPVGTGILLVFWVMSLRCVFYAHSTLYRPLMPYSGSDSAAESCNSLTQLLSILYPHAGMQIINDQLTITNATEAQIRLAFKEPVAPAPVPAAVNPSGLTPEQQVINALSAEQQAALVEFMQVNSVNRVRA